MTRKKPTGSAFSDRDLNVLAIIVLVVVAWIAYAGSLHNSLTFDDVTFSAGNRTWDLSLTSIAQYFNSDAWASAGKETGLYRPLFLLEVVLETRFFGDWYVGHHIVNVLLHSLVTIALFGLIRYLLLATGNMTRLSTYAALFATLVFAVHPLHTEVVNSIFNRSGMWVALGVIAGLLWFLPRVDQQPGKSWAGLNLVFLLILFCKETAVMLPAITVATLLLVKPGNWSQRIRKCLPVFTMLLPLIIFLTLRSFALSPGESVGALEQVAVAPSSEEPVPAPEQEAVEMSTEQNGTSMQDRSKLGFNAQSLLPAVKVWFDGLGMMIWPNPLLAFHRTSGSNIWLAFIFQALLAALSVAAFLRKNPGPLLGLAIYYTALLPESGLVSQAATYPILTERSLYLPATGIAIALAFLLYRLFRKFSVKIVATVVVAFMIVVTPLTWARNAEWASTLEIVESDYNKGRQSQKNLQVLLTVLFAEGNHSQARQLCDKHQDQLAVSWYLAATCGQIYQRSGLENKAEKAFMLALNNDEGKASAHYSLAQLYLAQNKYVEAEKQFEMAIKFEKQNFMKEVLAAEMLVGLYPDQTSKLLEAKTHLERAIRMQPQVLFAQKKLDEVNTKLKSDNGQ